MSESSSSVRVVREVCECAAFIPVIVSDLVDLAVRV